MPPQDAELRISIDPRSLDPIRLLVWEMRQLRDRLRLEGQTEHADAIDGMLRRLEHGSTEASTEFIEDSDGG